MQNPIEKRLQVESFKRLAETFLGKENFNWWAILYVSLIFIVAGWLPDGIAELFMKEWISGGCKTAVSLLILFYIGLQLKKATEYRGKIEVISEPPHQVKALAIFLSVLSMQEDAQKRQLEAIENALSDKTLLQTTIEKMSWNMPLIAIKYHRDTLQHLYIFTSSGNNPSSALMTTFESVIKTLFPTIEIVEFTKDGIDFENVKEVFEKVEEFYQEMKKKGLADKDIIIDITGGQKTNSIAAAMATLSIGRKFQYVSTRDKKVLAYDIGYFGKS
jgi:hypothetical protein